MNTKKIGATFLLLISAVTFSANAAAVTVSGKLIEESTNEPLEYANVVLLTPDSAFIAGTVSLESGIFKFEKVEAGNYLLKCSYLGFDDQFLAITVQNAPVDVGTVIMSASTTSLNEVVVTAKPSPFKASASGGIIANVSTTLLSTVGTANDVLQRIPGVVAENGAISVFGKGAPTVYINNRKVRDMSELERLESSEISTVELITNPGAKYDAEGRAVLLIKTKTKVNGFAAQVSERLRKGKYLGDYENISLSYTHERLNAFATIVHTYRKSTTFRENNYMTINNENEVWYHETFLPENLYSRHTEQISGGIDYSLSDKHALGGQYQFVKYDSKENFRFATTTLLNGSPYETSDSKSNGMDDDYQHLVNAFYNGDLSKNFSLHLDFDYLKNHDYSEQTSFETINNADSREIDIYNCTDYDMYAAKLINTWKSDIGEIEFGGEYNNIAGDGYVHSSGYTDNSEFSNTEQKAAGFVSYSHKILSVNMVAGLRYEYTHERFTEGADRKPFIERNYSDWYPNITLSTEVKDVNLSLTFNKRTKRPTFSQLNGNVVYVNRFVFQKGNPYLNKSNTYEVSFQTVRRPIFLTFGYEHQTKPIIAAFSAQGEENNAVLSTYNNFPNYSQLSAMLNFTHTIGFWQPNYTAGVIKPFFKSMYDGQELTFDKPFGIFNLYNDFTLPMGFVLSCNFQYMTPPMQYYMEGGERKQLDLVLRKSLLDNTLRFNLSIYDVFDWRIEDGTLKYNNMYWVTDKKYETRYATLSITYLFNNYRKKYRGDNAAKDDMERF